MIEVIAEQGINANGDLKIAKKLIDIANSAGCKYVKFQKRDIDLVYSKEELDKPRESPWGTTTRQQKEGLEFNKLDYIELDFYCQQKGIQWFVSPWDINSIKMMNEFPIPFMKVPSALLTNLPYLESLRETGKPIILSTGMSTMDMVDTAIDVLGQSRIYSIMHCTSTYPTDPKDVNLLLIKTLQCKYPWAKIGFSNHYSGLMALIGAAIMGCELLELHITLDRTLYGSDQAASIEPSGLFDLMGRLAVFEKMRGNGIKTICDSEVPIMAKLRRVQ